MDEASHQMARQAAGVRQTAVELKRSAEAVKDSTDRNTQLAADRNVLAAERTYAAWVRTALAALAAGIGAKAVLANELPDWAGNLTGTVMILFSILCFVAAIWRELNPGPPPPVPDVRRVPVVLILPATAVLIVVDIAALVGIWFTRN